MSFKTIYLPYNMEKVDTSFNLSKAINLLLKIAAKIYQHVQIVQYNTYHVQWRLTRVRMKTCLPAFCNIIQAILRS
jgi:hypothetical protein